MHLVLCAAECSFFSAPCGIVFAPLAIVSSTLVHFLRVVRASVAASGTMIHVQDGTVVSFSLEH